MPKVIFLRPNRERVMVEVPIGTHLMRAATYNGLDEIIGDCGGALSCATCHVFVDADRTKTLPPPSKQEQEMLDYTAVEKTQNSRLACQITMTAELDGLEVEIASRQL